VLGLGVMTFIVNAAVALRRGSRAENPWQADSLEWSVPSPPPVYKFAEVPTVSSRYPLWSAERAPPLRLRDDRRAVHVTTLVDARVDHTTELPGPSAWPAGAALATAAVIVACIFTPWGLPVGIVALAVPLIGWFWPKPPHKPLLEPPHATGERELELSWGAREPLFWGVMLLIAIEATGFALLLGSYFYLSGNEPSWPPPGVQRAELWPGLTGTLLLLATVPAQHAINRAASQGDARRMRRWMVLSTVIALAFVALRFLELLRLPFYWDSHAYGSIVWVIIGYHTLHAITGVIENGMLIVLLFRGPVERKHALDIQLGGFYWYFMVASWLPCFVTIYLERFV
jgi:heme/copper-type cytochrome/quinol oxidase subunit 3